MKNILIIFITVLCSCSQFDCEKFKTGTFKTYVNGEWTNTIIIRTTDYQIEVNEVTGEKTKDKITWIDKCSYRLTSMTYKNKPVDKTTPDLVVKIIKTGADYAEIEAAVEGSQPTYKCKMVKID